MFVKNKANQIIRLNNKLVTGGARIARLYSIFYADKRYVEIQQAIKGEPIAINNLSNFAKKDRQSRHNRIYWQAEEYLGMGLGSHSYMNGERFHNIYDIILALQMNINPF